MNALDISMQKMPGYGNSALFYELELVSGFVLNVVFSYLDPRNINDLREHIFKELLQSRMALLLPV